MSWWRERQKAVKFIDCEKSGKYEIINGGSDDESGFSYIVK